MTFQDFLMNSPDGGLMIKVGDGAPIGGLPPWIASDPVNGGLMFKVNNTGGGGSVNTGVLQTLDGLSLDTNLQVITDQDSNQSTIWLSTTGVEFTGIFALNNGTKKVNFNYSLIATSDKTITIPNATGTMALTSDIPSFTGWLKLGAALDSTLRTVTDYAATSSKLQLATEKVAFAGFTGAATGNIVWQANGTLTDYTGWHQSDGTFRILAKNGAPLWIESSAGVNFSQGFGSGSRVSIDTSGNLVFNSGKVIFNTSSSNVSSGSGSPEGAVTAPVGSIFLRSDGGAGTSFYVKESGTGNTGWIAK